MSKPDYSLDKRRFAECVRLREAFEEQWSVLSNPRRSAFLSNFRDAMKGGAE